MSEKTKPIEITAENRHEFGGDARLMESATDRNGNVRAVRAPEQRDDSILNIYPGDVINVADPTASVQMGWGELSGSASAAAHLLSMVRSGWKFCIWDEWDLSEEFKIALIKDSDGKIVTNTGTQNKLCMMYRDAELMKEADARNRKWSDDIQEEKASKIDELVDEFAGDGVKGWTDTEGEARTTRAARFGR